MVLTALCSGTGDIKDEEQRAWFCSKASQPLLSPHSLLNHSWTLLYHLWGHCPSPVTTERQDRLPHIMALQPEN